MEKLIVAAFYKYVKIEKIQEFRKKHLEMCSKIDLRGRILVANEGINGSVSGTEEQVEQYKKQIRSDKRFLDIKFKEDRVLMHPFKKMIVKVKKEIVNFGQKVDIDNTGRFISPKEFLKIYKEEEDKIGKEVVILDARNNYESRVGKFKGALTSNIKTFREFPSVISSLKDKKDKKIVMYCTGGIRCEKASAYLKERGFKDVCQLEGGILNFAKQFPDTVWEGNCFVFDKRMTSNVNSRNEPITYCESCGILCDLYKNCAHTECDKFTIICLDCEKKLGGCCSKKCFDELMKERMLNKLAIRT